MIIATGRLKVQPSELAAFATDLAILAKSARIAEGCLFFAFAVEDAGHGAVLVVEQWRDIASQQGFLQHLAFTAFVQAWGARVVNELTVLDAVPVAEADHVKAGGQPYRRNA